jgi:hypothetical protein
VLKGGKSVRSLAFALALIAAGCASGKARYTWESYPLNAESIRDLNRGLNEVTLSNGDVVLVSGARAYGDVSCDVYACVRHKDIAGIRVRLYKGGEENNPLTTLIAAPVVAGVFLAVWAAQANHDSRQESAPSATPTAQPKAGTTPGTVAASAPAAEIPSAPTSAAPPAEASPPPMLPPSVKTAIWLRRHEKQNPNVSYSTTNPCLPEMPVSIVTDAEGFAWVYENRAGILDMRCLLSAAYAMPEQQQERRFRLWALGKIRLTWLEVHCAGASEIRRIVPKDYMSPNFSAFDVIAETLADDTTYVLPERYEEVCEKGLADPAKIPDRQTFALAVDPFSSPGSAPWLSDRKENDPR